MHVLILEIGGSHIECTYSFLRFLKLKGHAVSLCCNETLVHSFPERNLLEKELIVPNTIMRNKQWGVFWSIRRFIVGNKITHLLINTTEINLVRNLMFFIPAGVNITGLVHNAKKLESGQTFIKFLSLRMKKYFVLGDNLLSKLKPHPVFKLCPYYPIYFPKPLDSGIIKAKDEFWVICPGSVMETSKDHLALLKELEKTKMSSKIKFVFLGNFNEKDTPKAAKIIKRLDNVITFTGFVDYNSFHSYMQLADIVLPLIKLQKDEMYADARISGSYNLGLGYKLPFLFPQHLDCNPDLAPYSIYYKTMAQLLQKIELFCHSDDDLLKINGAYEAGDFKSPDSFAQLVADFIES